MGEEESVLDGTMRRIREEWEAPLRARIAELETGSGHEWCVMADWLPDDPHRGPMSEQDARDWVREWEETCGTKAKRAMFYVACRPVGDWEKV